MADGPTAAGLAAALRAVERGADPETQTPHVPVVLVFLDPCLALWPAEGRSPAPASLRQSPPHLPCEIFHLVRRTAPAFARWLRWASFGAAGRNDLPLPTPSASATRLM